jgi:hypothetical protein
MQGLDSSMEKTRQIMVKSFLQSPVFVVDCVIVEYSTGTKKGRPVGYCFILSGGGSELIVFDSYHRQNRYATFRTKWRRIREIKKVRDSTCVLLTET